MSPHARHVFLTGQPGVGKTTVVMAAVKALLQGDDDVQQRRRLVQQRLVSGFITEEVRGADGERVGFDVVTLPQREGSSTRGPLARRNAEGKAPPKGTPAVGKYAVDVASFEALAIPSIAVAEPCDDDTNGNGNGNGNRNRNRGGGDARTRKRARITVIDEVWDALDDGSTNVLGTIPTPRYGRTIADVERVRDDPTVAVVLLKKDNRDAAVEAVTRVMMRAAAAAGEIGGRGDSASAVGGVDAGAGGGIDVAELVPFLQEGQAMKLAAAAASSGGGRSGGGGGGGGSSGGGGGKGVIPGRGGKNHTGTTTKPTEKGEGGKGKAATREAVDASGTTAENTAETTDASPFAGAGGGCGPLVVGGAHPHPPPRVLLMGETASPLPDRPGEESTAMVDGERSMWKVLDDVLGAAGRGPEKSQTAVDQAEKNRRATHAGIAIWQGPSIHTKIKP